MATETLRPNENGSESSYYTEGDTPGYKCVDEAIADEHTTYIQNAVNNNTYARGLFNIPDSGIGEGIINKITVRVRSIRSYEAYLKCSIRTNGTTYDGSEQGPIPLEWTNYFEEWVNSPSTSHAWTREEINTLEIGVNLRAGGTTSGRRCKCTQVYVAVDYAPAPTLVSSTINFKYNVRALTNDTINCKWDVRKLVSDTINHKWHVRELVNDTVNYKWNVSAIVLTLVSGTLQLVFNARALVSETNQLKWNVRKLIDKSLQTIWNIVAPPYSVSNILELRWYNLLRLLKIYSGLSKDLAIKSTIKKGLKITSTIEEK